MTVIAARNRTKYHNFDVLFRKLFRTVVCPPPRMDWNRPLHEILPDWNGRVNGSVALHCNLDHHSSSLEDHRWVKRLMQWLPDVCGRGGTRPIPRGH